MLNEEEATERTGLLKDRALSMANNKIAQGASPSTIAKVASFGLNNVLVAVHVIGNGIILSSIGSDEAAAASLITSLWAVVTGSVVGVLLNSGFEVGVAMAITDNDNKKNRKIGTIIKTGWVVGGTLGLFSTASYLSMQAIMPRIVAPATGTAVGKFFNMFAIGAFTEPLIASNGMVIGRIEQGKYLPLAIPFLSMALYRIPALCLSYLFVKKYDMGAGGAGLGIAVGGLLSFLLTQAWFFRSVYKNYGLYNVSMHKFPKYLRSYLSGGWKLSLQRLSEWGNIAAITLLIGIWNNSSLISLLPALQANTLVSLSLQGIGQAAMMFISTDCKAQKEHYKKFIETGSREELEKFSELKSANKKIFYINNLVGLVFTGVLTLVIFLFRNPIMSLFLKDVTQDQQDLAETLLILNLVGLFPDAIRIISGGILRGWNDLLYPTLVSIVFMTLLGVSIGGTVSYFDNKNIEPIFWARITGIFLSALINCYKFYGHMQSDDQLYLNGLQTLNTKPNAIGELTYSEASSQAPQTTTSQMTSPSRSWFSWWQSKPNNTKQDPETSVTRQSYEVKPDDSALTYSASVNGATTTGLTI